MAKENLYEWTIRTLYSWRYRQSADLILFGLFRGIYIMEQRIYDDDRSTNWVLGIATIFGHWPSSKIKFNLINLISNFSVCRMYSLSSEGNDIRIPTPVTFV